MEDPGALRRSSEGDREPVTIDLAQLSRAVSHALRHQPWLYELELDEGGWVPIDQLLQSLRQTRPQWAELTRDDLVAMVATADKRRHEIKGARIRALYGHSLPGRLALRRATPPQTLFHGTSPDAWRRIRKEGLLPMDRQYVHLSVDPATAHEVGARKATEPIVLAVRALDAHDAGVEFLVGNESVWLAESVPREFLEQEAEPGSRGRD